MSDDKFKDRSGDQKKTYPQKENLSVETNRGNCNENIEGDFFEQSGDFGIGSFSGGEIKDSQVAGNNIYNVYNYSPYKEPKRIPPLTSDRDRTKKKKIGIITSESFSQRKFEKFEFTGRINEIERLENLLINYQSDDKSQIAVIWGIPGVGKSALAYNFANQHREKFTGGVYIVRVDEFKNQERPLKSLARWFAEKREGIFDGDDRRNPSEIMEDCFADGQALLIFDNADLIDDKDKKNINRDYIKQLSEVFPDKNCAIIVTTQAFNVLRQDWNIIISDENNIELKSFSQEESKTFLETIVKGHQNKLKEIQNPDNQLIVDNILNTVESLPIAIEIVGGTLTTSRWKDKTLSEYWEKLNENPHKRLRSKITDVTSGVWNTFQLSVQTLDDKIIRFFACIGACASGNFSLSLISAIAECEKEDAEYYLEELENRSLVSDSSDERYTMHNLLFLFAQIVLREEDLFNLSITFKRARDSHAKYFVELVNQNYYLPIPPKISQEYKLLSPSNQEQLNYQDIIEELNLNYEDIILAADWLGDYNNLNNYSYRFFLSDILKIFFYQYRSEEEYHNSLQRFYKNICIKGNPKDLDSWVNLNCLQPNYIKTRNEAKREKIESISKNNLERISNTAQKTNLKLKCLSSLFWEYIYLARHKDDDNMFEYAQKYLNDIHNLLEELKINHSNESLEYLFPEDINVLYSRYWFFKFQAKKFKLDHKAWIEKSKDYSNKIDFSQHSNRMLLYFDMRLGQRGEIYLHLGRLLKQKDLNQAKTHFQNAKKYLEQSLETSESLKHSHSKAITLKNLGKTSKELMKLENDTENKENLFQTAKQYFIASYFQDKELNNKEKCINSESIRELFDLYFMNKSSFHEIIADINTNKSDDNKYKHRRLNDHLLLNEISKLGKRYLDQVKKSLKKYISQRERDAKDKLLQKAETLFQGISEEIRDLPEKRYHVNNLNYLAEIAAKRGRLSEARQYFAQAIKQDKKHLAYKSLVKTLIKLASVYHENRLWIKECNIRYRIVKLNKINQEICRELSKSLFHLAKALVNLGDLKTASEKIDESIKICEDSNDRTQLCLSICEFIKILEKQNRSIETSKTIQKYHNLADKFECSTFKKLAIERGDKTGVKKVNPRIILKKKKNNLSS
ncbi:MAG: ATP-binding protein [Cyanobacteria bacterium P01_A01_bin.40]